MGLRLLRERLILQFFRLSMGKLCQKKLSPTVLAVGLGKLMRQQWRNTWYPVCVRWVGGIHLRAQYSDYWVNPGNHSSNQKVENLAEVLEQWTRPQSCELYFNAAKSITNILLKTFCNILINNSDKLMSDKAYWTLQN